TVCADGFTAPDGCRTARCSVDWAHVVVVLWASVLLPAGSLVFGKTEYDLDERNYWSDGSSCDLCIQSIVDFQAW
ncbi:MAG: hypothetical protein VXX57_00480, partial [Cyanobacteriota bacterium]|nr:hypothetical protein [Cyanobacteriota bacterium]